MRKCQMRLVVTRELCTLHQHFQNGQVEVTQFEHLAIFIAVFGLGHGAEAFQETMHKHQTGEISEICR